jgi:hypothetical protein
MTNKLLTRDEFREAVFTRDRRMCCWCTARWDLGAKLDAHHIIERRLFSDGGYYLDNGATVCEPCHLKAEQTLISCEELRERCGITNVILPPHAYRDQRYDKWLNPILDNGMRLRGELFDDESVQKVLAPVLNLFTNRVKYPRTYHLPWSPGATSDDRIMEDPDACFGGRQVVVTEKMDGENCTMYRDYIHARSLEYAPHPSRNRVKALWSEIAHDIPEGWRVCGENLYALHSIAYDDLESYFQVFSIWNEKNECLSWDETKEWASLLGLKMVREIDRRVWDDRLAAILPSQGKLVTGEGYVVRLDDRFHYKDFRRSVAKYVRAGHVVHRDGHWSNRPVVPNRLRSQKTGF